MIPRLRIWSFFETILRASVVDLNLGITYSCFGSLLWPYSYEAFFDAAEKEGEGKTDDEDDGDSKKIQIAVECGPSTSATNIGLSSNSDSWGSME